MLISAWKWYCFVLSKVVDYQARAGRREALSFLAVHSALLAVLTALAQYYPHAVSFLALYATLTAGPFLLLFIRRLHDLGLSVKWLPVAIWPPVCLFVFLWASDPEEPNRWGVTERLDNRSLPKGTALSADGVEYPDETGRRSP
jgi:uncharacterized membrane protein YhaH (DUF805 family)